VRPLPSTSDVSPETNDGLTCATSDASGTTTWLAPARADPGLGCPSERNLITRRRPGMGVCSTSDVREANLYHLLLAALLMAFGTATTLATAKGLQNWAIGHFESNDFGLGAAIAERPSWPLGYVRR
jgi:hypothetical protein